MATDSMIWFGVNLLAGGATLSDLAVPRLLARMLSLIMAVLYHLYSYSSAKA